MRESRIFDQGTSTLPAAFGGVLSMSSNSAALTPGWSRGWSRNHHAEKGRPDQARGGEHAESPPPADQRDHPHDQQRGDRSAPARAQPHEADGPVLLAGRQPIGEGFGQVGKDAGLGRAEEELRRHQEDQSPSPSGGRGEEGPQEHHIDEDFAGPDTSRPASRPAPRTRHRRRCWRQRRSPSARCPDPSRGRHTSWPATCRRGLCR